MDPLSEATMEQHIIAIAKEQGFKTTGDHDLEHILEEINIDPIIPIEAYAAVTEIISYLYQLNAKGEAP